MCKPKANNINELQLQYKIKLTPVTSVTMVKVSRYYNPEKRNTLTTIRYSQYNKSPQECYKFNAGAHGMKLFTSIGPNK